MGVVKRTIVEFLLVLVVAAALGFGFNPIRGRDEIKLTNDYFPDYKAIAAQAKKQPGEKRETTPPQNPAKPAVEPAREDGRTARTRPSDESPTADPPMDESSAAVDPPSDDLDPPSDDEDDTSEPDHPFQEMTFDEAADVYEDPNTELGVNVFIDARNDAAFAAGHVPGAIQCDRYRLDEYIDTVMMAAEQAEKVIVYCNGGQCDDSKALCGELIQRGIPYHRIFLYSGGWEEWKSNLMPYDTGGVD